MKKFTIIVLVITALFLLIGCPMNQDDNLDNTEDPTDTNQDDNPDDNPGDNPDQNDDPVFSTVDIVSTNPEPYEDRICDIVITLSYSSDIDESGVNGTNVKLVNADTNTEVGGTVSYADQTISFTPAIILDIETNYDVVLQNLTDTEGLILRDGNFSFKTGRTLHALYGPHGTYGAYYHNSPAIMGDHVYVGQSTSDSGDKTVFDHYYVYKLTKELDVVWQFDLNSLEQTGSITFDSQGNIYFYAYERVMNNTILYKLDSSGAEIWSNIVHSDTTLQYLTPSVSPDGTRIYSLGNIDANYGDCYIYSWNNDNTTGEPDGEINLLSTQNNLLIDNQGYLYTGSRKIEPDLSEIIWSDGYSVSMIYAFSPDQSRYYGITSDEGDPEEDYDLEIGIASMDTSDGTLNWEYLFPAYYIGYVNENYPDSDQTYLRAGFAVDAAGTVYFGTKTNSNERSVFYAVNEDGSEKWKNEDIGYDFYNTPVIGNDNTIYVGSEGGRFNALDMDNGTLLWDVQLSGGDITHSSMAIDENGLAFVGVMYDYFFTIQTDCTGYQIGAGWPRYRGGSQSTGGLHDGYTE